MFVNKCMKINLSFNSINKGKKRFSEFEELKKQQQQHGDSSLLYFRIYLFAAFLGLWFDLNLTSHGFNCWQWAHFKPPFVYVVIWFPGNFLVEPLSSKGIGVIWPRLFFDKFTKFEIIFFKAYVFENSESNIGGLSLRLSD